MKNITGSKQATLLFFCIFFSITSLSLAQVSIAPTSLHFDNKHRVNSLTVSNGGQQAQEVSITTEFGYPTSNDGRIVISKDSTLAPKKSIVDWIKVFPKSFTLQPQSRQTIQFIIRPPQNVKPGGYWSRVTIQSNPVSPPIESVGENQVGAQINLVVNQIIPAHYRTPDAQTGVKVNSVNYTQDEDIGTIAVSMEQMGNAPFIGSVNLQVKNSAGQTVYQTNTTNSVYTTITRTFDLNINDLDPGQYTVTGSITSERRDISQDKLLQIRPVSFQKQITIE
jgi:hypothetical protein